MTRLLVAIAVLLVLGGCSERGAVIGRRTKTESGSADRDHLISALDYLQRANEFEEGQATLQVAYHLNRWLDGMKLDGAWQPDRLIKRLPKEIRDSPDLLDLGRPRFHIDDVRPLQEAVWMRQVANWASRGQGEAWNASWLKNREAEIGSDNAGQLVLACRLFDWTVRNVQLDALLPYPADVVGQPQAKPGEIAPTADPPAMRGIPGPGYQHHPWQSLLYGHGDALQRASVFILLCRQQGIDAVLLAFPGRTIPPRPRPWLPAAHIGDQLYLFDTHSGLPVPGTDARSIATLENVLENPKLLEVFGSGSGAASAVDLADLSSTVALLDASADALSRRMQVVEKELTGEQRTILSTSPSAVADRVRKCRGITDVTIWTVPFETKSYQAALKTRVLTNVEAAAAYFDDVGVFSARTLLVQARCLHLRGDFDNVGDTKGAISLYLDSRLPQSQIERLIASEEVQRQLGFTRMPEELERDFRRRVIASQRMMTQAKEHATYWLGVAQYETGRFESALEWLERRTLNDLPKGRWSHSARYNLARTYETMGQTERAREVYLADDDSPQRPGNRWRAQHLKEGVAPGPEAKKPAQP